MTTIAAIIKPVRLEDARNASALFDNDEAARIRADHTRGRGLWPSGQTRNNLP
jgi:hypothetical protein